MNLGTKKEAQWTEGWLLVSAVNHTMQQTVLSDFPHHRSWSLLHHGQGTHLAKHLPVNVDNSWSHESRSRHNIWRLTGWKSQRLCSIRETTNTELVLSAWELLAWSPLTWTWSFFFSSTAAFYSLSHPSGPNKLVLLIHKLLLTRSLAIAKRPCDCCIILKSGSYTKAI